MQDSQTQRISTRQNIEQQRGAEAWRDIRAIKELDTSPDTDRKLEKEYRSLARGLNAMIQINGLGQTLGFLSAKGKQQDKAHYQLLLHLTNWMKDIEHFRATNSSVMQEHDDRNDGLLQWVIAPGTSSEDYRRATTECLAFGVWLRRFAEAELKEPETEGGATPV